MGGIGESPFTNRCLFAPATSSLSPYSSSTFLSVFSVPHIPHITGSRYFKGFDLEQVDEIDEEKICRDVPVGQTAYDAAHKNKVFHLCKENRNMPEQVQDKCIDETKDDDMIVSLMGQTACDAAHNCRHEHGYGGDHGHGGRAGEVEGFGKK